MTCRQCTGAIDTDKRKECSFTGNSHTHRIGVKLYEINKLPHHVILDIISSTPYLHSPKLLLQFVSGWNYGGKDIQTSGRKARRRQKNLRFVESGSWCVVL